MTQVTELQSHQDIVTNKPVKKMRWIILALFVLGVTLNYVTRNSLGILAPELKKTFSMSNAEYGYVTVAFQAAYTMFQPFCGWLIDFIGLKIGFAICALLWSLSCMAHAGVGSWMQLAILRFFMGSTEAAASPSMAKLMTDWFPKNERTIANGWGGVGFSIGGVVAPPLIVGLHSYFGWKAAFVVPGAIGILWSIVWWKFYDSPAKSKHISQEEQVYILTHQDPHTQSQKQSLWASLGKLLATRRFYGIGLPAFLAEPAWQTMSFWVPLYMSQVHGFKLKEIALFAILPFLMADIGSIASGYLAPYMRKKFSLTPTNSAIATSCSGAVLMICLAGTAFVGNAYEAVILISIGGFGHQIISSMLTVLVMETTVKDQVATTNGLRGTFAWVAATISTLAIGSVTTAFGAGAFTYVFICLGFFDLIGAAIMASLLWERKTVSRYAA